MRWGILILFFLFSFTDIREVKAQKRTDRDSLLIIQPEMDTTLLKNEIDTTMIEVKDPERPNRVVLHAAILPGMGQIANKKYWKLPILYGGAGTILFYIDYNNKKYQQFRNAYLEQKSLPESLWKDPLTINVSADNLNRGIDFYRRNRDLLMILLAGVYFIQIVDAYVDAQLMDFDISEDLTFRIQPGLMPDGYTSSINYGLKFVFIFN
jgi:hypothetical protein